MTPYPVLLCIPHSGQVMPKELEGRVVITTHEVFEDSDAYTKEIFDLGSKVIQVISTEYARAFIDMNRNLEDIPPAVPDGMIKSMTCYQTPIYKEGKEPDENLIGKLVSKYYRPYHNEIVDALKNSDLKLGLDCHSMAAFGPDISPDVGQKRPTICLGNCLDKTCTRDTISNLADCFSAGFEIKREEIKINKPFLGKYTTQRYGLKPIPWVHVELNRKFFLEKPWFDNDSMLVDNSRLKELNKMFEKTLSLFFEE
jgi:N-formylglutamate deformylase